jgi:hypothetical protein
MEKLAQETDVGKRDGFATEFFVGGRCTAGDSRFLTAALFGMTTLESRSERRVG